MTRSGTRHRLGRLLVRSGSCAAVALTAHTWVNLRLLRVPPASPPDVEEPVSVLLPLRDEADRVRPCLESLLAQERLTDVELLVLDDGSTDATAALVAEVFGADPRWCPVGPGQPAEGTRTWRLLTGEQLPPGWLGKPHACAQLSAAARGRVLVLLDADVVLQPLAVASTVSLLRERGLDLVSPYPRQVAGTVAERLVQPLLQWSWVTTLPLRLAERSARPSMAAANGQLIAVDTEAYRRAGGHGAVRSAVLDDVELLRAVIRSGGHGVVVDGTDVASCRMYTSWRELREGYAKSLWSASGSPLAALAAGGALAWVYVVPPVAALRGSRAGTAGFAAAVLGRVLVARRVGGRVWPDSLGHPVSVVLLGWLTARSWVGRRRGTLRWKGRSVR